MNKGKLRISGGRVILRPLTIKDATSRYANWLNDPIVNKFLETRSATILDLKDYIQEKNHDEKALLLGIFLKNSGVHIGNVKLEPIDMENKTAQFGLLIGDKNYWEKGFGTEVTKTVVKWAFEKLNLKKVELGVIANNIPAIDVYKKAGFKILRTKKKAINHSGVLFDEVIMAVHHS